MFLKNFVIKQRWRIAQTYQFLSPLVGIINTFLYAIIAIGVTDFIDLTVFNVTLFIVVAFLIFNILGWFLDRQEIFSMDQEKAFETVNLEVFKTQADYNALKVAYYDKFPKEELEELIRSHKISRK